MAQKSKKGLYIGIGIVALAIIVSIIVYYYMIVKPQKEAEGTTGIEPYSPVIPSSSSSTSSASSGSSSPVTPTMTNTTLLEWKSPLMKGDRVQWVQNAYNKVALKRKSKNKLPDWPIIQEDGVFGENTHKAVNRVMGKYKTTWTEFKQKTDQILAQL